MVMVQAIIQLHQDHSGCEYYIVRELGACPIQHYYDVAYFPLYEKPNSTTTIKTTITKNLAHIATVIWICKAWWMSPLLIMCDPSLPVDYTFTIGFFHTLDVHRDVNMLLALNLSEATSLVFSRSNAPSQTTSLKLAPREPSGNSESGCITTSFHHVIRAWSYFSERAHYASSSTLIHTILTVHPTSPF